MSDPVLKLQIIARTELALAQIRAQRAAGRSVLFIVAMVFALIALGMFNLAAFHGLSKPLGPALAALIVALIDAAVTAALLAATRKVGPRQNEEALALKIRDLAYTELQRDVDKVKTEITQVTDDLRSISATVSAFTDAASNTITPLLGMLVKSLK